MSSFDAAIVHVLAHEAPGGIKGDGGYNDTDGDAGGPTKWGLSQRYLESETNEKWTAERVAAITLNDALNIYRARWWDRYGFGRIKDQLVAAKVFDIAVNGGPGMAGTVLQRAINELGVKVEVDGAIGPQTIAAANACLPEMLLNKIVVQQGNYYRAIVASRPSDERFLDDWLKRAAWPLGPKKVET